MGRFRELFSFKEAAVMLGVEASKVRSLVVEVKRLPATYVTHMGRQERYGLQVVRVDDEGRAFDLCGGYESAPHIGFVRVQRSSLERFMRKGADKQPAPGNDVASPVPQTVLVDGRTSAGEESDPIEGKTATVVAESASNVPARKRRDLLAPTIEAAQRECNNPLDAPAVWAAMVRMAGAGKDSLLGASDDGIKWLNANDEPQFFSLKNLRDRLRRSKKRTR